MPQIHSLTAIRGLAAWWVVLYHFRDVLPPWTPLTVHRIVDQGYIAVDLFFILSGFVIALNYRTKVTDLRWETLRSFLGARLARIYPLHFFMLLAYLANPLAIHFFSNAGLIPGKFELEYYIFSLILVQNWGFTSDLDWNVPAWSISTEWFAYLVFAPVFVILLRSAHGVTGLIAGMVLLLVMLAVVLRDGLGADIPTLGIWRCVMEFQLGVLICLLRGILPARPRDGSTSAAMLALLLTGLYIAWPVPDQLIIPTILAASIWALTNPRSVPSRLLDVAWLRRVGEVSYSTYLVHFFVKDWVKFVVVRPGVPDWLPLVAYVLAVYLGSALLYRYVEKPGQRLLRTWLQPGRSPVSRSNAGR